MSECLVNRFDHIEIAAKDIQKLESLFNNLGFICTQERKHDRGLQRLMLQGNTRLLLTQGRPGTFACNYAEKHGDGVCSIAYTVENVEKTLKTALDRGAELAQKVESEEDPSQNLRLRHAAIKSFGDVRATFIERSGAAFDVHGSFAPGFEMTHKKEDKAVGLLSIDHLTNNVEMGMMDHWSNFYKKIYGWVEARYFDIRATETGLHSKVLQSPDGAVKIPVNEATEAKSQVQEFIDLHKGAGVQHIALTTIDIRKTVRELRKRGFKFLEMQKSYYEKVKTRVANVTEPIHELQELDVLVDGDDKGYLLQIFTENQIGPLFFEVIQRKGNNGFGEGNFSALFEAIERDQKKRGVL